MSVLGMLQRDRVYKARKLPILFVGDRSAFTDLCRQDNLRPGTDILYMSFPDDLHGRKGMVVAGYGWWKKHDVMNVVRELEKRRDVVIRWDA